MRVTESVTVSVIVRVAVSVVILRVMRFETIIYVH